MTAASSFTPGVTADQIGPQLRAVRDLARAERKAYGHVRPDTQRKMQELLAEADAFVAIEDAKNPKTK